MIRNTERIDRLREALRHAELDAFVCTLGVHVLMISGYSPVIGTSFATATSDGSVVLLVPKDEQHLARTSWADSVIEYEPSTLKSLRRSFESSVQPLGEILREIGLTRGRIGYEHGPVSEPASYAAVHIFGGCIVDILRAAVPSAELVPADKELEQLTSVKTSVEIERLRLSCDIAGQAFKKGISAVVPGATEARIADAFRRGLSTGDAARRAIRSDGFAFCMSGENSAKAFGAFAQTSHRTVRPGDLVMVHCNSYADGYWTDITRTYVAGEAGRRELRWYEAVQQARVAVLETIRPGVRGADVDRAAREVLLSHGLGDLFRHSTGHGVGFAAISANALPRLHPLSSDVLEEGMVFNVEPAVYAEGFGGLRHCDMVSVTGSGAEIMTPFQSKVEDLILRATSNEKAA